MMKEKMYPPLVLAFMFVYFASQHRAENVGAVIFKAVSVTGNAWILQRQHCTAMLLYCQILYKRFSNKSIQLSFFLHDTILTCAAYDV